MKKALLILLVLSLCISFCACGAPTVVEKEVEKIVEVIPDEYEQFKDVVDALVKEEYDAAQALIEKMKPVPETPPIKEVTITTENFFDYFEYVEFPEYGIRVYKDSADNLKRIDFYTGYYLKEGYIVAEEKRQDCNVRAGVKYNDLLFSNNKGITVDLENRSYIVTGQPIWVDKLDYLKTGGTYRLTQDDPWSYFIGLSNAFNTPGFTVLNCGKGEYESSSIITDLELVSASGTLYLYE